MAAKDEIKEIKLKSEILYKPFLGDKNV